MTLTNTLGFCISKPRLYSRDLLEGAILDCDAALESSIQADNRAHMQEQKASFQAELKRRRSLPLSQQY